MSVTQQISAETYEKLALTEPDRKWELVDGHLREKPAMTFAHNTVADDLGFLLTTQLDRAEYRVRVDKGHVRRPGATYFIPDVFVFPLTLVTPRLRQDDVLEVYDDPLPLVVEVWSPPPEITTSTSNCPFTRSAAIWRSGWSTPTTGPSRPGFGNRMEAMEKLSTAKASSTRWRCQPSR